MNIGIVGNGVVGHAIARVWVEHTTVKVYDVVPEKCIDSLPDVLRCDIVFVCLPTPKRSGHILDSGTLDTLAITELLDRVSELAKPPTILIKSTVPIGYTKEAANKFPTIPIVYCPEFLTSRCAVVDAHIPSRIILGFPNCVETPNGQEGNEILSVVQLSIFFQKRFPGVPVLCMGSNEAEATKLMTNAFFATKISFFNEMRAIADRLNLDWDEIIKGILSDGRIAYAHTQVPGPDGNRGFGGSCLPKDTMALAYAANMAGIKPHILSSVLDRNMRDRDTNKKKVDDIDDTDYTTRWD